MRNIEDRIKHCTTKEFKDGEWYYTFLEAEYNITSGSSNGLNYKTTSGTKQSFIDKGLLYIIEIIEKQEREVKIQHLREFLNRGSKIQKLKSIARDRRRLYGRR